MWIQLVILAAILPDPEAVPVTVKWMSFDEPQRETVILDAAGKPETVQLYSHSLSPPITCQARGGMLSVYHKPTSPDPKSPVVVEATAALPPGEIKLIALLAGSGKATRLHLIPDRSGASAAGTLRFFNLCPEPLGLSLPGDRQVIPSGRELVVHPKVKPSDYGQAQFFLPNEDSVWEVAGGLRWLQLNDIRSLLFLLPAPGEPGMIVIRGIEERIIDENQAAPSRGAEKKATNGTVLR